MKLKYLNHIQCERGVERMKKSKLVKVSINILMIYALFYISCIKNETETQPESMISESVEVQSTEQKKVSETKFADQEIKTLKKTFSISDIDMVFVEGGSMEIQGNMISLDSFYMNKYELTWTLFNKAISWANENGYSEREIVSETSDNTCAVIIAWTESIRICNYLSLMEGLKPVYYKENKTDPVLSHEDLVVFSKTDPSNYIIHPFFINWEANGYRLPTEAEWEYAARGGQLSKGYTYSGSDNIDEVAWSDDPYDFFMENYPVAQKKPNELGLYDMSGNAAEWCIDLWNDQAKMEPHHNPNRISHIALIDYENGIEHYLLIKGGYINYQYLNQLENSFFTPKSRIKAFIERNHYGKHYQTTATIRIIKNSN